MDTESLNKKYLINFEDDCIRKFSKTNNYILV